MCIVGVTDYLGLSTALNRYKDKLSLQFRCVLVDESQDFGTIEYALIRKLVEEGENDLFFCGDAAQQVSAKHRSFKEAGIDIPLTRSVSIKKNYRNSREILQAAYDVLVNNLTEEMLDTGDFEILDPEHGNFSGAPPLILKADNLDKEIAYSLQFFKEIMSDESDKKYCLAICGYSIYQIQQFGEILGLKVLDGSNTIESDGLYLSDLEHTKGFEFDAVVIANCNLAVLPDITKPEKEQFRDLARFYVAMTRAKNELIVSCSKTSSPLLQNADDNFLSEQWPNYVSVKDAQSFGVPPSLDEIRNDSDLGGNVKNLLDLSGPELLYTNHALGLSSLLIDKLRNVVSGKSLKRDGNPVTWATIRQARKDIESSPRARLVFGPEGLVQFRKLIEKIELIESKV